MRLAAFASLLTAGAMWLALGGSPVESQSEATPSTCKTCGQKAQCPHCASKNERACQGEACRHRGHYGHHGKWGAHKHEYKCVRPGKKPDAMSKQFSGLGEDGWRLVQADGGTWCFGRIQSTEQAH